MSMTKQELKGFHGVTYSQFDNHVGPRLIYSYPTNVLTKEEFENLSDYAIVGKHLCEKILIIKNDNIQFLNYSIAIENSKYERNTILFSFGLILDIDVDPDPFSEVLKKLSYTFVTLELECEYLFQESTRSQLPLFLEIFYYQLNYQGEVFIAIDDCNIFATRLFKPITQPREILDYEVPSLLIHNEILATMNWDITIRHIIQYIDGFLTTMEIAHTYPGMDIDIVKRALQILLYYKCILLADKVKFSNIYQLTNLGHDLIKKQSGVFRERQHVATDQNTSTTPTTTRNQNDTSLYINSTENIALQTNIHSFPSLSNYHPQLLKMLQFSRIVIPDIIHEDNQIDHSNNTDSKVLNALTRMSSVNLENIAQSNENDSKQSQSFHNNNNVSNANKTSSFDTDITNQLTLLDQMIQLLLLFTSSNINLATAIVLGGRKYCHGLNLRRLISYGQFYGYLNRIYEYPIDTLFGSTVGITIDLNQQQSITEGFCSPELTTHNTTNINSDRSINSHININNNLNMENRSINSSTTSNAADKLTVGSGSMNMSSLLWDLPSRLNLVHNTSTTSNSSTTNTSAQSTVSTGAVIASDTVLNNHSVTNNLSTNNIKLQLNGQSKNSINVTSDHNSQLITLFLDGTECIDAICVKYNISPSVIYNIPNIKIVYK